MLKPTPSSQVSTYLAELSAVLDALPREPIAQIVAALIAAAEQDQSVYILGNGGSAATASHLACDLIKSASRPGRSRLRAIALTDNVPLMTAIGNDLSYEEIFSEQIRGLARPGDVVIAISASGTSPNVIHGVTTARELGASVIGLTGFGGGQLRELSDICLVVPSNEYGPVEDMHMIVVHAITAALRNASSTAAESVEPAAGTVDPDNSDDSDDAGAANGRDPLELAVSASPRVGTIFLDRDGVINRNRDDYVKSWSEFSFLPGACQAIARLSQAGYRIFVITNQACIHKSLTTVAAVDEIHQRMREQVAREGGEIEAVLLCPHGADAGCGCRKPSPGLLLRARDEYGVDLSTAMFIGDSAGDMRAAAAAGVPALLVLSGLGWRAARAGAAGGSHVSYVARDLQHAATLILDGSLWERARASLLRTLAGWVRLGTRAVEWASRTASDWASSAPAPKAGVRSELPRA